VCERERIIIFDIEDCSSVLKNKGVGVLFCIITSITTFLLFLEIIESFRLLIEIYIKKRIRMYV
jgi:hypothetical protein